MINLDSFPSLIAHRHQSSEELELEFITGNKYTGKLSEGFMSGFGEYKWTSGTKYKGTFINNIITGSGVYSWMNGVEYQGEMLDNKKHGYGVLSFPNGTRYEGDWKHGYFHGKGVFCYNLQSGEHRYEGDWSEGTKHGEGTLTYPNKNSYKGEFHENKKQGMGTYTWYRTREAYSGEWHNDHLHGFGKYSWHSEITIHNPFLSSYEGEFVEGMRCGRGVFQYSDGSRYEGGWRGNMKHGDGVYVAANGNYFSGVFVNDKMLIEAKLFVFKTVLLKYGYDETSRTLLDCLGQIVLRNQKHLLEVYKMLLKDPLKQNQSSFVITLEEMWRYFTPSIARLELDLNLATASRELCDQNKLLYKSKKILFKPQQTILFIEFLEFLVILFLSKFELTDTLIDNTFESFILGLPVKIPIHDSLRMTDDLYFKLSKSANEMYDRLRVKYEVDVCTIRILLLALNGAGYVDEKKSCISILEFTNLCFTRTLKRIETYNDYEYQLTHAEMFSISTSIAILHKEKSDKSKTDVVEVIALLKPIEIPRSFSSSVQKVAPVVVVEVAATKNSKLDIKSIPVVAAASAVIQPAITFLVTRPIAKVMITAAAKLEMVEHLEIIIEKLSK